MKRLVGLIHELRELVEEMSSKERLATMKEIKKEVEKTNVELDRLEEKLERNKIKYSEWVAQVNTNHTGLVN